MKERVAGSSPLPAGAGARKSTVVNEDGSDGTVRNYAYYKDLRKKLGSKYYEPHIQQALIRDRKALGDDFFDKPNN
jgi:hypothetical protein